MFACANASLATTLFDAAIAFYKALKVYPSPGDLINIYDQTVSKVRPPLSGIAPSGSC
ncbi:hypothetical protein IMZ48_34630 [Candidatus Bathyarchaeota archaeon]|nr:hypothetical protein [Candidatus Bathyarchaeota archaeon]